MQRILIVDDSAADRALMRRSLVQSPLELEILEASDGRSGMAVLESQAIDCVLLDYQLPDCNGLEFLDGLSAHHDINLLPMVMLTGTGSATVAVEAMKRGVVDYLPKDNLNPASLQRVLSRALELTAIRRERNRAQDELAQRTAELQATNAELAATARAKDEFLASMSHELRTPLNAILNLSEILQDGQDGPVTEKQQHYLQIINESGQHLLALIDDVLDVARVEAGELKLDMKAVEVSSLCEASLRLVRPAAGKKGQRLTTAIDTKIETIQADERRLKQILVNLLSNAIKFTPSEGSIGLEVNADADTDSVVFRVWDTGIGIKEEAMGRLFKPFVQLDNRLAREYGGSGLGLSLVFHMVKMHGGSVAVESKVGEGSCFSVALPWKNNNAIASQDIPAQAIVIPAAVTTVDAHAETTDTDSSKPLILIAEDNEHNILAISAYLQAKDYRIVVTRDGSEAIRRSRELMPDLILMDIQMPGMDGLEAIQRLRDDDSLTDIPIIALTALAMPGDRERCLQAGANEYLSKPVSMKSLVSTISELLGSTNSA